MPGDRDGKTRKTGTGAPSDAPPRAGLRAIVRAPGLPPVDATLLRQALGIALLAAFLWLLRDRLAALDPAEVLQASTRISAPQWALAGLATAASFGALAQYDALIHRLQGTHVDPRAARRAGWSAIALSQTIGFGLVSGALVRWRMLPGLSIAQATRLTATVAASFLAGWAVLTALVLALAPKAHLGLHILAVQGLAGIGLVFGGALGLTALLLPEIRLGARRIRLPGLRAMGRILVLAALDTGLAALALWVLLPAEAGLGLLHLYPAFLLALGAGFVSGTPGGIGPFEITLVSLLPAAGQTELLGAVLAWRLVYYAAPALIALAAIARRPGPAIRLGPVLAAPTQTVSPRVALLVATSPQAELGLLHQGEHGVLFGPGARSGWMIGRAPQTLVALLDPFGRPALPALIADLERAAKAEGRSPVLYKISGRVAAQMRAAGWQIAPVAEEVWLAPQEFHLDGPARAGLRRKLRKAHKAGVTVSSGGPALPFAAMGAIACDWAAARGGERGFSMGRYAPEYLRRQEVFLAWRDGRLIGFASFHANAREWVLDLMRPAPDAPDGTMQALIAAAITQAAARGVRRLSLAALPPRAGATTGPAALIWRRVERDAGAAGLRQFKMSFAPRLSPRYIAAPSRSGLMLAASGLLHAIRRPRPLPGAPPGPRGDAPRSRPSSRDRNCTFARPMAGDAQICASKKGPGHDQYAQAPARDP